MADLSTGQDIQIVDGAGSGRAASVDINNNLKVIASGIVTTTPDYNIVYRAAFANLVAPSGVFFSFGGSASSSIRISFIRITNVTAARFTLSLRSTADSGGTSTTMTQVVLDSAYSPGAATIVKAYTVSPTLGTLVGLLGAQGAPANGNVVFEFGRHSLLGAMTSCLDLAGTNQCIDVAASTGGVVNIEIEWSQG